MRDKLKPNKVTGKITQRYLAAVCLKTSSPGKKPGLVKQSLISSQLVTNENREVRGHSSVAKSEGAGTKNTSELSR